MYLHLIQGHVSRSCALNSLQNNEFVKLSKSQARWYSMHPGSEPSVTRPGKSVNKWSGDVSLPNIAFTRLSKPLAGVSPPSRPFSQETMCKLEKYLNESTVVYSQAPVFNCCVKKITDEIQVNLRLLRQPWRTPFLYLLPT